MNILSDNKHACDTVVNTCIVQLTHTHLMNAYDDKDLDIKPDPQCHHICQTSRQTFVDLLYIILTAKEKNASPRFSI